MTQVSIEGLTKVYPGADAPSVDNLTLDIESGDLAALLGPSGCGKTTTMKMIAGLLPPTSGNVSFDGRSVLNDKPENRGVVMVFQNYLLFPYMNVADNIGFGLKMRKVPKPEIARRVAEMLELVDCRTSVRAAPGSSRGASSNGWRWRAPSSFSRRCCCSTSPCRISTRICASRCATSSAGCSRRWASPRSS